MRVRLRYSVKGRVRFISHLDLMRMFFRACIRKDIPVAVSQGYSPHLKLSFGPPLNVGVSSCCEYLDIYLKKPVPIEKLKSDLQEGLPEGIRIEEVNSVSESLPALSAVINGAVYSVEIPPEYLASVRDKIEKFFKKKSIIVERKHKPPPPMSIGRRGKSVDIRPLVNDLRLENDSRLVMSVTLGQKGSARPIEVISSLWPELELDELRLWKVRREELLGL